MTVADDELARIGSMLDHWDREDAGGPRVSQEHLPAPGREALAFGEALQPIIGITIKLGADVAPGAEAEKGRRVGSGRRVSAPRCPGQPGCRDRSWPRVRSPAPAGADRRDARQLV